MLRPSTSFQPSFQSTLPVGGATAVFPSGSFSRLFQSTLPVGGATQGWVRSISAILRFQSTLPVGGATGIYCSIAAFPGDFNPRSPWGERRYGSGLLRGQIPISIHAPRGGSDALRKDGALRQGISIHAPRGGSDIIKEVGLWLARNFNPRSPWGERRGTKRSQPRLLYFNPRSPWGERRAVAAFLLCSFQFQSTLPVGGATGFPVMFVGNRTFQSTLPVGGATCPYL